MNKVHIYSPATIANVSCGFDVIGLALEYPVDEIKLIKSSKRGVHISNITGYNISTDPTENVATVALNAMLNNLKNIKMGFEMEIYKNINPGSGLGSSAASAAGSVIGANLLLGNPLNKIQLIKYAMVGERLASGSAHADNVVPSILGGITLIRSYNHLIKIHIPQNLWVTVIHPQIEIKTYESREILKKKIYMTDAIQQWGNVGCLVYGLYNEDYDIMSRSLEDVIVEPIRSILIPYFNEIKIKCKEAGALGGSISGSGPSVYMFSNGKSIAYKVAKAMDKVYSSLNIKFNIYISSINRTGIRCL